MNPGDKMIGLNERAQKLIAGCKKPHYSGKHEHIQVSSKYCDTVVEIKVPKLEGCVTKTPLDDKHKGLYLGELHEYHLRDGTIYREVMQAYRYSGVEWSGYYCVFLALHGADGASIPETLWTEEEMQKYL